MSKEIDSLLLNILTRPPPSVCAEERPVESIANKASRLNRQVKYDIADHFIFII